MPNQWLTIAKLGGASARAVEQRFRDWQAARVVARSEESSSEPSQWPPACHAEMDRLVAGLHANAEHPPVLFYCRYVDMWSMFVDLRLNFLEAEGKAAVYAALCPTHELYCLRVLDKQHVLDCLERQRAKRTNTDERGWYLRALSDAVTFRDNLVADSLILCVRTVLGGLVEDEEVEASLAEVAAWIEAAD